MTDGVGEFTVTFSQFMNAMTDIKLEELVVDTHSDESVNILLQSIEGFKDTKYENGMVYQEVKDDH